MANLKRSFCNLRSFPVLMAGVCAFFSMTSCQSAQKKAEPADPVTVVPSMSSSTPAVEVVKPIKAVEDESKPSFDLTLSSDKAPDGSLLYVEISRVSGDLDSTSLRIKFEGEEFPVFRVGKDGKRFAALVVIPFNSPARQSKIDLTWTEQQKNRSASVAVEVVDGKYRSETLTVNEKKVSPPKKVMKRILKEVKEIAAIYKISSPEKLWEGPFVLPLNSEITSPFGNKRLYNGHMKNFHQGLDLRARTPLPINAPAGGKVALAKDLYFTGNTVILDHGYGLYTIYGHMSKFAVKVGDKVTKDTVLGLSGATGRVSGPHLHWGGVLMKKKFNPQDLTKVLR